MGERREGRALPAPATQQDMYLAAIVEELERLNDNIEGLTVQPAQDTDEVALREPEVKPAKAVHRDAKKG